MLNKCHLTNLVQIQILVIFNPFNCGLWIYHNISVLFFKEGVSVFARPDMVEVVAEGYESFTMILPIFSNFVIFIIICMRIKHFNWHLVKVCITKDMNVGGEWWFIFVRNSHFSLHVWLTRVYTFVLCLTQRIKYKP